MSHQGMSGAPRRHAFATRIIHALFAFAIVTQLLTSLVMRAPRPARAGADSLFILHEYAGLSALAIAGLFWVALLVRRRGTEAGALFPWLSGRRLRALWADAAAHASSLRALEWPRDGAGPLASAIHGLGLLLMTLMAVTGAVVYVLMAPDGRLPGTAAISLDIHRLFANLVWAYLIGHAGLAVLHQMFGAPVIAEMWSLRPSRAADRSPSSTTRSDENPPSDPTRISAGRRVSLRQ